MYTIADGARLLGLSATTPEELRQRVLEAHERIDSGSKGPRKPLYGSHRECAEWLSAHLDVDLAVLLDVRDTQERAELTNAEAFEYSQRVAASNGVRRFPERAPSTNTRAGVAVFAAADQKGPTNMELTSEEKEVCRHLGITKEAFAAELERQANAGAVTATLTEGERRAADALGISHEAFAAERDRIAADDGSRLLGVRQV